MEEEEVERLMQIQVAPIRRRLYTGSKGIILPLGKYWHLDALGLRYILYTIQQLNLKYAGGDRGRYLAFFNLNSDTKHHRDYGRRKGKVKKPGHSNLCQCGHTIGYNFYIRYKDKILILGSCCIRYFLMNELENSNDPDLQGFPATQTIPVPANEDQQENTLNTPAQYYVDINSLNQELLEQKITQPIVASVRRPRRHLKQFIKMKTRRVTRIERQNTINERTIASNQSILAYVTREQ